CSSSDPKDTSTVGDAGVDANGSENGDAGPGDTDATAPANCTEITVTGFQLDSTDTGAGVYTSKITPDTGAADSAELAFYGPEVGGTNGDAAGPFDLGTGADASYATCSRCLLVYQDVDTDGNPAKTFFQKSGTLTVDAASHTYDGSLKGTLTDVTL